MFNQKEGVNPEGGDWWGKARMAYKKKPKTAAGGPEAVGSDCSCQKKALGPSFFKINLKI